MADALRSGPSNGARLCSSGEARRELTSTAIGVPRRSHLKAGVKTVVDNIFLLTGHRKFYHLKEHSTSWTSPSSPPPTLGDEEPSG